MIWTLMLCRGITGVGVSLNLNPQWLVEINPCMIVAIILILFPFPGFRHCVGILFRIIAFLSRVKVKRCDVFCHSYFTGLRFVPDLIGLR